MSDLNSAIAQACEITRCPIVTYDQFPDSDAHIFYLPELGAVHRAAMEATPETANAILHGLAPAIREADPFQAARLALLCGSLVEGGGDPTLAVDAVVDRLPLVLTGAALALDRLAEGNDPEALFAADPDAVKSWKALRYLVLPAMAMLTRDVAARQRARAKPELREALRVIEPHGTDARFLSLTLDLCDGLELLVVHPGQGKGFRVGLEAVASNGHLFTLLQGALIGDPEAGLLDAPPPDETAVGVATGQIVPQHHVSDQALFHYYDWSGVDGDPAVADLHMGASVWVDGRPEEIPDLEGTRIILLGTTVFGYRGWDSSFFPLFHDALRPRVHVLETLTPEQVAEWVGRMKEAVRAAGV
jgi:hypothetical protein